MAPYWVALFHLGEILLNSTTVVFYICYITGLGSGNQNKEEVKAAVLAGGLQVYKNVLLKL